MGNITEYLPFLIPLIIAEAALVIFALWHILTHKTYKRGTRAIWIVVSIIFGIIGPIVYFVFGREEA
ncbi:MAG: PLDc_N domain-containing protein [Lachnospiraceae bacterium]|nr:PLDc_N domain-containing protein [Lachnospiraceae bacterium]